jgi:hypothetical protein
VGKLKIGIFTTTHKREQKGQWTNEGQKGEENHGEDGHIIEPTDNPWD